MSKTRESLIQEFVQIMNECHSKGILFDVESRECNEYRIVFFDSWDYFSDEGARIEAEYTYSVPAPGWIEDGTLSFNDEESF